MTSRTQVLRLKKAVTALFDEGQGGTKKEIVETLFYKAGLLSIDSFSELMKEFGYGY